MMKTLRHWIMMMSLIGAIVSCGDNYSDALKDEIQSLTSPLEVFIKSHNNGQVVTTTTITLSGEVTAPLGNVSGQIIVNGVSAPLSIEGKSFSRDITLMENVSNNILVIITDQRGKSAQHEIAILCDTQAPIIAITSHLNNDIVADWSTVLTVHCQEFQFASATLTVNGSTSGITLINGDNYIPVMLSTDGAGINTIQIDGRDLGNLLGSSGALTLNLNPLITPPNGYSTCRRKPSLDWSDYPGSGVTYTIQVANDAGFASMVEQSAGLSVSQYSLITSLSVNSTYYWRVQVVVSGVPQGWIKENSFYVDKRENYTYFTIADTGRSSIKYIGDDAYYPNVPASRSFTDGGNGTITDNRTGLMWTKCSMLASGTMDSSPSCTGTRVTYTWGQAVTNCDTLTFAGYSDWRLPSQSELLSIVDFEQNTSDVENLNETASAMVSNALFPKTEYTNYYWTATQFRVNCSTDCESEYVPMACRNATCPVYVNFWPHITVDSFAPLIVTPHHLSYVNDANNGYYVRCVRGNP